MSSRKTIIFIISAGHSGSTLLTKLLGQDTEMFSGGELIKYCDNIFASNSLCSCGAAYSKCSFWKSINEDIDINEIRISDKIKKTGSFLDKLFLLLTLVLNVKFRRKYTSEIDNYLKLYETIFSRTNAQYIVDSSKLFFNALILSSQKKYNYKFIYLHRDGRAVLNSYLKKYYHVTLNGKTTKHERMFSDPAKIIQSWRIMNFYGFLLMIFRYRKTKKISHEDIVNNTNIQLESLLKFLIGRASDDSITKLDKKDHIIGGNASKINAKKIEDIDLFAWRETLSNKNLLLFRKKAGFINKLLGYK